MKRVYLMLAVSLMFSNFLLAQSVGIGTNSPNPSALLELSSANQGFLPPRLTTSQRDLIQNPATGLTLYNTTVNAMQYYNGSAWVSIDSAVNNSTGNIGLVYGMETNTNPGGYAYALNTSGNWVSQILPYVNQGYKDTFSRTQMVVYGMETITNPGGYAFAFTENGSWVSKTLPYVNQGYKATACQTQIVVYGMETNTNPGGYAFALTKNGTWVSQTLPYVNQGYKASGIRY